MDYRLSTASSEEIDGLAETLNKMAADLKDKLDTVVRQRNERDAILSSMVEGVLAIDTDQRLLRMNEAAARLLGIEAARAEGRSLPEVVRNIELHKLVAAVIATQQPPKARSCSATGSRASCTSTARCSATLPKAATAPCW